MIREWIVGAALLVSAAEAKAFCGFYVGGASSKLYNNATQVVLMRDGTRTVLSMQNNYQGPPDNFAMVIPVPIVLQKENVKTLPKDVFDRVDLLDSPRLVEYWEQDPCPKYYDYEDDGDSSKKYRMDKSSAVPDPVKMERPKVKIEAQFTVEEYEIVILSATESTALETWLTDNKYSIPKGAASVLKPYVDGGLKFFVAKVDSKKVKFSKDGQAMLSPLRFHYDSESFALPIRLGMLNAKDKQDLIVHVLAKDRYEVSNYKNVFIPTNIEMADGVKDEFAPVYAALFDKTLDKNPGAVVTEYSWVSNNCDPCPVSPISDSDAKTLGADMLPSFKGYESGYASALTLTRLHARYDSKSLGEDLVFSTAKPVVGGREEYSYDKSGHGKVKNSNEATINTGGYNNFQARYIIRHPWKGPISCSNPVRGVWGGPPDDPYGWKPQAARDLAFVERGSVSLPKSVKQDVPAIDLKAQKRFFKRKKKIEEKLPGERQDIPNKPSFVAPPGMAPSGAMNFGLGFSLLGGLALLGTAFSSRKKRDDE